MPEYLECCRTYDFEGNTRVYIYSEAVDMRNAVEGLSAKVKGLMHQDPLSGELFVFGNRNLLQYQFVGKPKPGFYPISASLIHICEANHSSACVYPIS